MKKKRDDSVSLSLKVTRIMKITLILILVGVIQVSATTYAQEHRISVSVKNGTFYDVVSQIERQSEFMFFYKSEEIDGNQRINLNAKNKLVSEILDEITKNNNLTYKVYKNEDWIKDNIDHCTNNGGEHTDLCKSLCCNERVHSHNDQYKTFFVQM